MTSRRLTICAAVWLVVLLSSCTDEVAPVDDDVDLSTPSDAGVAPGKGSRRDASAAAGSDSGAVSDSGAARDAATSRTDSGPRVAADAGADHNDDDDDVGDGGGSELDAGAQVGLPPGVAYLFPPPSGVGLCPDPPLRIRFAKPPTLGSAGKIQVYEKGGSLVASVDMAAGSVSDNLGGTTIKLTRPVTVDGNDVVIGLKTKALGYGKSYYVTIDAGVIKPASGAFSLSGTSGWTFSTRAAPASVSSARVALDGSGDFCSVQGALDALPANNTRAVVTVAPGLYHEVVHIRGKSNVTLRGEDRKRTVILGTNNENLNPGTATRALVGFDGTNGLIVENLTIHNLTPQGGKQAEALRIQGCDKCIVRHADILSLQDTLLWSGRIYANDCYVEGNVDYVWGTGTVFFEGCEFRTVGRTGVIVQARNAANAYGYVFVDCKLTADGASPNNILARVDASVYPASHVAFIDCEMNSVAPTGWTVTGGGSSQLRFWEYGSHDAAGQPVGTTGRLANSSRISSAQAQMMRDPSVVLNGWTPPEE